jgi:response regulator RpfG family c-di-GMP phosphodiesterase
MAEDALPRAEAIAVHLAQAMPDVIVKDCASQRADGAGWLVQTDRILRRHARCPVLLVGDAGVDGNKAVGVMLQEDCT